jgi:hypothetical protein
MARRLTDAFAALSAVNPILSGDFGPVAGDPRGEHCSMRGDNQWIGLRENLQETMVFTIKYRGFL